MARGVIESKFVLSAEDKASASIAQVVKAIKQISEAEKVSAKVDKLARSLLETEKAQKAVTAALAAQGGFRQAQNNLAAAGLQASKLAGELDKARRATDPKAIRTLGAAHRRAEAEVRKATAAVSDQAAVLRNAEAAVRRYGGDLTGLGGHQRRLQSTIENTTRALRQQVDAEERAARTAAHHRREMQEYDRHMRRHGAVGAAVSAASGVIGLHGTIRAVEHTAKAGAEVQGVRVDMAKAGIPARERGAIEDDALKLSTKYKNVTQAGVMELAKEIRSVLTHPEEVPHVLPDLVRAKSLLDAKDATGNASRDLGLLVKGAESIGAAKDPHRFVGLLDGYVKAMQVMGKTVTPEGIYEMQKYSKVSGARWSDRFTMTTALSLAQEMGGSTAGNSIQMAQKQIVGGMQNLHSKAKAFAEIGLIDPKNLDRLKNGEVKGVKANVKHAVKGDDVAASDLDQWVFGYLVPHLNNYKDKKTGKYAYRNLGDKLGWIQKNFTGTAGDVIAKILTQQESFEAHARMYGEAKGLDGVDLNKDDPTAALGGLTKSMETFAGVLASPVMKDAANILDGVSTKIGELSVSLDRWNKAHPDAAKGELPVAAATALAGTGWTTYKLAQMARRYFGGGGAEVATKGGSSWLGRLVEGAPGLGVAARLGGAIATPLGILRDLGEAHRPMTPDGAPYRLDQKIDAGTWERAQRGAMEFRMDPEGKRGREMMRRPGILPQAPAPSDQAVVDDTILERARRKAAERMADPEGYRGNEIMRRNAAEAWGKETGEATGDGIVKGIREKADTILQQGREILERLGKEFSPGIRVPIHFVPGEGFGGFGGGGQGGGIQTASFSPGGGGMGGLREIRAGGRFGGLAIPGGGGAARAALPGGGGGGSFGGRALAVGSGAGIGHTASKEERAAYIRQAAIARGIDPEVALRVAQSEGFNSYVGDQGRSFGDWQLFTGGGVGNRALATGINIRDPNTWKQQTDFALDVAKREGWGQWYGAARVGIGRRQGLDQGRAGGGLPGMPPPGPGYMVPLHKGGTGLSRYSDEQLREMEAADTERKRQEMERQIRRVPEGASLGGGFGLGGAVAEFRDAVGELRKATWRSHHTVEVSASPGSTAKTTGMRAHGAGPIQADVGISMPGAEFA